MPLVVAGSLLRQTRPQRQNRLCPIQRLYLRFFIHAQHDGMFGRIQIQAHDIPHLLHQPWISRQLERFAAMRLQTKAVPDADHGALTQPDFLRQRPRTPLRGCRRQALQRLGDSLLHHRIRNLARRAGPRIIRQTFHALHPVALRHLPTVAPVTPN